MSLLGQSKAAAVDGEFERLLVVASGPVKLALPAPIVQGMLPLGEAGIKDIVTVRGNTYRVTPLAGRWNETPSPVMPETLLLLCEYHGQDRGFTADKVLVLIEVAPGRIRALPSDLALED